jgi:hypothetical protein
MRFILCESCQIAKPRVRRGSWLPRPFSRDSPDESQTGINVRVFPALLQDRREVLIPAPRAARTVVEWPIWPFSLAFGRTPYVGCS